MLEGSQTFNFYNGANNDVYVFLNKKSNKYCS